MLAQGVMAGIMSPKEMATMLQSKFVTVEGVRLHYQELGSGYPVICIHGAGPGASAESGLTCRTGVPGLPTTS